MVTIADVKANLATWFKEEGYDTASFDLPPEAVSIDWGLVVTFKPNPKDNKQHGLQVLIATTPGRPRLEFICPSGLPEAHQEIASSAKWNNSATAGNLLYSLMQCQVGIGWETEGKGKRVTSFTLDTFAYEDAPLSRHLIMSKIWTLYTAHRLVARELTAAHLAERRIITNSLALSPE